MIRYPGRLTHKTPGWVERGSTFHIRIRIDPKTSRNLTDPVIGPFLLESAGFYHTRQHWACRLFLLMPDHLHALLRFPYDKDMGRILASWEGYHTKQLNLGWQGNYFDHRIRNQQELDEKEAYIRMNPVRKGLCATPGDWPWVIACTS